MIAWNTNEKQTVLLPKDTNTESYIIHISYITIILNGLLRRMNSRRHETEQALAEVDKDDDGFVNYAEFVKFMKSS